MDGVFGLPAVPPVPTTTPDDATLERIYTTVLLRMNGSNNSTTIIDECGHSCVCFGDAKLSTTQSKFWPTSAAFDGSGDYIEVKNDLQQASLHVGMRDFTFEGWVYPTTSTRGAIFAYGADYYLGMDYHYFGTRNINIYASSSGTAWNMLQTDGGGGASGVGTLSLTLNAWNHFAYTRKGETFRSFVNGVKDREQTGVTGKIYSDNQKRLRIGTWGTGTLPFTGYIAEFRMINGYCKYTANFTIPSQPFGAPMMLQPLGRYSYNGTIYTLNMSLP